MTFVRADARRWYLSASKAFKRRDTEALFDRAREELADRLAKITPLAMAA